MAKKKRIRRDKMRILFFIGEIFSKIIDKLFPAVKEVDFGNHFYFCDS